MSSSMKDIELTDDRSSVLFVLWFVRLLKVKISFQKLQAERMVAKMVMSFVMMMIGLLVMMVVR